MTTKRLLTERKLRTLIHEELDKIYEYDDPHDVDDVSDDLNDPLDYGSCPDCGCPPGKHDRFCPQFDREFEEYDPYEDDDELEHDTIEGIW